jgi:hypothetical protein
VEENPVPQIKNTKGVVIGEEYVPNIQSAGDLDKQSSDSMD